VSPLLLCEFRHPRHHLQLRIVDTTFFSITTISPFMSLEKRHRHDLLLACCLLLSLSASMLSLFHPFHRFLRWLKVVILFHIPTFDQK
jgi:hypothetical protein